jgi:hypothetical protein
LPANETDDQGASASNAAGHGYVMPFEFGQCLYSGPGGCYSADTHIEGKFEYNGHYAWWKNTKPKPKCPYDDGVGFSESIDNGSCDWAGQNHQPYKAGGYHISAQVLWHMTSLYGVPSGKAEHMTVYAYGSGYANSHNTDALCNPLTSC